MIDYHSNSKKFSIDSVKKWLISQFKAITRSSLMWISKILKHFCHQMMETSCPPSPAMGSLKTYWMAPRKINFAFLPSILDLQVDELAGRLRRHDPHRVYGGETGARNPIMITCGSLFVHDGCTFYGFGSPDFQGVAMRSWNGCEQKGWFGFRMVLLARGTSLIVVFCCWSFIVARSEWLQENRVVIWASGTDWIVVFVCLVLIVLIVVVMLEWLQVSKQGRYMSKLDRLKFQFSRTILGMAVEIRKGKHLFVNIFRKFLNIF